MSREQIIQFIRENAPFYRFVNFEKHSDEQLAEIKKRAEEKRISPVTEKAKTGKSVLLR